MDENDVNNHIQMIMNQTDMSYETARNKLNEYNNDSMKVIYEYFGIKQNSTEPKNKSVNQMIYKEIRNYMNSFDTTIKK
jgi:hypothetical protein